MATTAEHVEHRSTDGFRHEALLYAGDDGFLRGDAAVDPRRGRGAASRSSSSSAPPGSPACARSSEPRPSGVTFADMADVGVNPARIIPAWREFVDAHAGQGRRLRGIGEPIWAERSPDELVECQRHEALLNVAFAGAEDFWLLCPYDVDALGADVIDKAHRSHPAVVAGDETRRSDTYEDLGAVAAPFAEPLPEPPPDADALPFAAGTLASVRRLVELHAGEAGLSATATSDLVLAVNEVATNSVRHGGGEGVLSAWLTDEMVIFEVADAGAFADPLAGRVRPA